MKFEETQIYIGGARVVRPLILHKGIIAFRISALRKNEITVLVITLYNICLLVSRDKMNLWKI